jgi:hypothetical protein
MDEGPSQEFAAWVTLGITSLSVLRELECRVEIHLLLAQNLGYHKQLLLSTLSFNTI